MHNCGLLLLAAAQCVQKPCTDASADKMLCCRLANDPCVVLQPCFLMEKTGVDVHSQGRELCNSIQEYLILCMQMHKISVFHENQRHKMLRLAPLHVVFFVSSSLLTLPPSKPQ